MMALIIGVLTGLGLALLLAVGWMGAPRQDITDLIQYLLFSGGISLVSGIAVVAWLQRGPGKIWQQVTVAYAIGLGLAILNVMVTAQLMFISADHDLLLLILLLLFAAVVSQALGYTLAQTLAQRVIEICEGARAIRLGNLATRVPENGRDELADLAHEFNLMADQLTASDQERQRLERMRRELIAAISHDLRTPLASVRAMVEALADGVVDDPETMQRYLATMRGQISHLSGLIDDLFELSQLDSGAIKLDYIDIIAGDMVSDTVEAFQAQARERNISLSAGIQGGVGRIRCAPQKIERVLYNLIGNALRHTPPGGRIDITLQKTANGVRFEVRDSGEGIAPDDLPLVFDRFYRGEKSRSRATGGAGLGLAIARGIIEAHGGTIEISSTLGQGTLVWFVLPSPG
jgi:signal transduction histidine kinase